MTLIAKIAQYYVLSFKKADYFFETHQSFQTPVQTNTKVSCNYHINSVIIHTFLNDTCAVFHFEDKIRENMYVLPDNVKVLPENIKVLPDNVKVLPENIKVLPDNVKVLPENIKVLPDNVKVLPENIKVLPDNVKVLPENIKVLPDNVKVLPENIKVLPDNVKVLPENVKVLPDNIKVLPENLKLLSNFSYYMTIYGIEFRRLMHKTNTLQYIEAYETVKKKKSRILSRHKTEKTSN